MYIVLEKVLVIWAMTHGLVEKRFPPLVSLDSRHLKTI